MPRDDRKPVAKADDGWFIDFDDEDALDITALTAARRSPAGQNRPPRRPELRPMTAGEPGPEVGARSDPAQGASQPPEAPELSSRVGSTSAKRDEPVPRPARQVAQASTQAAPAPGDIDPGRGGLEVDQTRQARSILAAGQPERELHAPISEAGADQQGARTAEIRVRRRIAGASLLAACLVGGVLLPFGLQPTHPLNGGGTGEAPISEALAEPTSQRRSAPQTQWQDPSTVAMPIRRPIEATALAPSETVETRETILISAVLAPFDAGEVQSDIDTVPTLQPDDVRPIPPSNEERAVEPLKTLVARMAPAVEDDAPAVAASAKPHHAAKPHTVPTERATWVEPDEVGRSPSPVSIVRSSQRPLLIQRHLSKKAKPAAPSVRVTTMPVAPMLPRSNAVAHRPSPAVTGRVASRQIAVSGLGRLDQKQPPSSDGPQVSRAEPPRALVLPTSLQPTPF